jgi:hypothetical protein
MKRLVLLAALICAPAVAKAPATEWAWHCTFADGSSATVEPKNQAYFRCGTGADGLCIGYHASFATQGDSLVMTAPGGAITMSISRGLHAEETVGSELRKATCAEGPPTVYDPSSLR